MGGRWGGEGAKAGQAREVRDYEKEDILDVVIEATVKINQAK